MEQHFYINLTLGLKYRNRDLQGAPKCPGDNPPKGRFTMGGGIFAK